MTGSPSLDVIAIGRSSVDLYGAQVGGRLEDMASFSKAVGGCPTNIAVGTARLGLRSGLVTRVGDEHMGRFVREQLIREGVDTAGVHIDPDRLTSLVLLGIRDEKRFPLIFYRDNCADSAIDTSDIDEGYIASAGAIVVTGTHFARQNTAAAQRLAMRHAKAHGRKVILDVDYRPNLWGLAGHGAGEERFIASDAVSAHLAPVLADCDVIVGTEEELMIAGGVEEPLAAIRAIRALAPRALIVCKRGPMGCVAFDAAIPDEIDAGIKGPGFPVEVYNVLGAGDAFMSGFLRGYLRGEPIETALAYANACGAFAVSRLLCSAEYPSWDELQHFLRHGPATRQVRHDKALNDLHWATTRDGRTREAAHPTSIMAFAIDHRMQLEAMADETGASRDRIRDLKVLAVEAAARVAGGRRGFGMLIDGTYGREALFRAADQPFWIGRPVELPGSRPLDIDGGGSLAAKLIEWPVDHCVKCLCFMHPDDPADLQARQERELLRLQDASRTVGRELLVEIIAGKHGPLADDTVARVIARLYAIGIRPDWWKLEGQPTAAAWAAVAGTIREHDPLCRGIMLLGLDAPLDVLGAQFRLAAACDIVRGFAVGRSIFGEPARAWLSATLSDGEVVDRMAERFRGLVDIWTGLRPDATTA
ncbi:5-dehydro-2-deoxygluconokinase [Lichenibacterium minor]|uniref:5-dehydro-2-deoxygluconokinase n=1 Tax=Lichenibacterium minor TaxID=2316528 RepID=A0A4Q2U2Y8_9HYPH|nr:5-dehydro-2-deoxygluconokinase [Lichenibacterium minor]RYC29261.1 5-dehydro-2-deoxygluconokinase [Lichenibacterium minor]